MKEYIISNINEFNTSEGYFGNSKIEDDCITIPYFNMGLMPEHPLNSGNEQLFIDFSFLQIIEPKYISVHQKGIIKNDLASYDSRKSQYFGGVFIGDKSLLDNEMEVQASEVLLIIPKGFKASSDIWIPNYKQYRGEGNIHEIEVMNFLEKTKNLGRVNLS